MRIAWLLLGFTACAAPGLLPDAQIAAALRASPVPGAVSLALSGGRITWIQIAVEGRAPEPAERTAAGVQPDGELRLRAREWSAAGAAWRFVKEYPDGQRRSLLVGDDGLVLERTHTLAAVPAAVQPALGAAAGGDVERVEVVQGAPGQEWYRVTLAGPGAAQQILELALDGRLRSSARRLSAVLHVADP